MGGCRCSYKNCTNTTKSTDTIHFFHYPVRHKGRCIQWIENANKPSFYILEEEQLRNKVICELHFEDKWFPNNQKKRLLQGAIPTLDGDCNDVNALMSPMESDAPVYLPSNQYSDVKVLPANEDGTVFVLDTENMFTISPKIESYIIKNGVLVPTNSNTTPRNKWFIKQSTSNRFTKPSTSTAGYVMGAETEIANINTPPGSSKPPPKEQMFHRPSFVKRENSDLPESVQINEKATDNGEFLTTEDVKPFNNHSQETEDKKPNIAAMIKHGSNQQGNVHGHSKTVVSKSYLRQIKQHSRDIASIKRMLKQKRLTEPPKPDMKTILNELHQQLPPSLLTIISLLLGKKLNFISFFYP